MKKLLFLLVLLNLMIIISGCGVSGAFQTNNVTNVELSEPNFKIVAKDVTGSAMQGYLLGISYSQGSEVGTFGFIKVSGVEKLYDSAVKDLWSNYEEKYGDTEGKNLLLINIRQDSEILNTILYTETTFFITADVVEFI